MAHPQLAWRHAATTKMLDVARLPRFYDTMQRARLLSVRTNL
jgi:hypothetical protein